MKVGLLSFFVFFFLLQGEVQAANSWVKLCEVEDTSQGQRKVCSTFYEGLHKGTGKIIVSVILKKIENIKKEEIVIKINLKALKSEGMRIQVDDYPTTSFKFHSCSGQGDKTLCVVKAPVTPDVLNQLMAGNKLLIAALNENKKPIGFPVPLSGFVESYIGSPINAKKYYAAKRKLLREIKQGTIP